jgi:hypothetical protein
MHIDQIERRDEAAIDGAPIRIEGALEAETIAHLDVGAGS